MKKTDCLIIIPAYNEEQNINRVLQGMHKLDTELDIVVINDGSRDKTLEQAKKAGCKVITLPYNLGYGGALQTGFKYAVKSGYQFVIQFDADGQHAPEDIPIILDHLRAGVADIVVGSRFMGRGSYATGTIKKMVILVFRFLIKICTGVKITDPTSGLQGLARPAFTRYAVMGDYPEDYPDADTLISMLTAGYRVVEFPANIRARQAGKSMHTGMRTLYYFVKMLVSILVVWLRKK